MAVSNVSEMGPAWSEGVQGKQNKFERAFQRSRDDVIEGLRQIGLNPGSEYTSAVRGADASAAASAWATKVQGKESKFVENYREAIES